MEWFPYRLKLRTPIRMPGTGEMTHREGFLLYDPESGGWGDAAPLPVLSSERLEDVRRDLEAGRWGDTRCASLRFAVECARTPWPDSGQSVKLNALWLADREPLDGLLDRIRDWADPTVKIKPGLHPDPDLWNRLLEARPETTLRLDANRCWTVEMLRELTHALPRDRLEYVEEPLDFPKRYLELDRPDDPPIALDESLRSGYGTEALGCACIRAVVIKPSLMGNAHDRSLWMERARKYGWDIIWSSSLESGVGLWHLARMAAGGAPAGLDTAGWLAEDVVRPRPISDTGLLEVPKRLQVDPAPESAPYAKILHKRA